MNYKSKRPYKYREDAPNKDIRAYLREKGISQWQLAAHMGIHEYTLVCKLRQELPDDKKEELKRLIDDTTNEREV